MKCQVCKVHDAEKNTIVCSDNCNDIRLRIIVLSDKYTPTNGCENCWGDLGIVCTDKCQDEFNKSHVFITELFCFVRLANNVI